MKKSMSKWDLLSVGVGAVIGWSWVIYGGYWGTMAGTIGGIITFVLAAVLCSFVGLVYAELTSAFPRNGVDVSAVYLGMGHIPSVISCWCVMFLWCSFALIEPMMFPVIMGNLGIAIPQFGPMYQVCGVQVMLSDVIIVMIFNTFFAYVNFRGANVSGRIQTACVILLAAAALFMCGSGFALGSPSNVQPVFTSAAGFTTVMLMVPGFMSGFNAIPQGVEEADVKPKTVGKLVVGAVWGSAIFYILIIAGLAFAVPYEVRSGDGLVVIEAVRTMFGGNPVAVGFVTFASLVGMLTTWNAAFLAGSRFLNSMSRAKMLPPVFADLHPKYQTPHKAVLLLWVLGTAAAFLGKAAPIYYGLMDINGFTIVVSWLLISVAFLQIRRKMPDLERPFRVSQGMLVGVVSAIFCTAWLFLYTPWGPSGLTAGEWIGLIAYILAGVMVYLLWNRRGGKVERDEMLELLFGRKF